MSRLRTRAPIAFTLMATAFFWTAADAQRAADNAATSASDAFGTVVGNQTIGLYNEGNARGFSPMQAENVRIEGLYYDQQPLESDPYLFSRTDMRVGIAAQAYEFPSPSGIADLTLRTPGETPLVSAVLIHGPLEETSAEIDAQYPLLGHSLSVGLIVAAAHDFDNQSAATSTERALSLLFRWRPTSGSEVVPFFGYVRANERMEIPLVYLDGVNPPPVFDSQHLPTQSWTAWRWNELTAGVIARLNIDRGWTVTAGLFHSVYQAPGRNFMDLALGPRPNGIADHVLSVTPGFTDSSYSGDVRLTRTVLHGTHRRQITLSIRGRHVHRESGGDAVVPLGSLSLYQRTVVPEPPLAFSALSHDRVRQTGFGVDDIEEWNDRVWLTVGGLITDYVRSDDNPGMPATAQRTTKVLPTVSLAAQPFSRLTAYVSYTHGLEDSQVAPSYATNRGASPPATPTWQADGGVRFKLSNELQLLLGTFEIHKTYFAVDTANLYAAIGDIQMRGLESSATWTGSMGLTVVAGAVWLRPEVVRRVSELGATGTVPIGPVPGTVNFNVDYAPENWRGWGASMQWNWLSSRVATSDDRYSLPALNRLDAGLRYTGRLRNHAWSGRFDVGNVTNTRGLSLGWDYSAIPQLSRNYALTLAVDL